MPATGPRAPARTLVAVRAMVPVTQMPPNRAEAILATPCATSSQLERCRRPVMLSATTAESRLSMLPSSAKESAAGSTSTILASESAGRCGAGSDCGMPPKRVPIVSTGRPSSQPTTEASADGDQKPGQCGRQRRSGDDDRDREQRDRHRRGVDGRQAPRQRLQLRDHGPGSLPASVRPSRSLIWLAKMMTAMPAVKPTVTG